MTAGLRYADDLAMRHLQNFRGGLQSAYGVGLQAEGAMDNARRTYLDAVSGAATARGNASALGGLRTAGYVSDAIGDAAYGFGRWWKERK